MSTKEATTSAARSRRFEAKPVDVQTVAPGVLRIELPIPFPPGGVAALAIEDKLDGRDVWTIVDTGLRSAEPVWRELLDGPLAARPVGRVIATHYHPDHIGCAGWFQTEFNAELWTTRTAWLCARMLQLDANDGFGADKERFFQRCGYDEAQMERARNRAKIGFSIMVAPLPLGYRRIVEGENIEIGGRSWRVLIGDGHAQEHALLLCEEEGILIAGDQILPRISPNIGVYPAEPEEDALGDWLRSCAQLRDALDDEMLVVPGHGDPFRGAASRLEELIGQHRETLDRLESHLAEPRRLVDCFETMYGRPIKPAAEGLATVETLSHLRRLVVERRAERTLEDDGAYRWRKS